MRSKIKFYTRLTLGEIKHNIKQIFIGKTGEKQFVFKGLKLFEKVRNFSEFNHQFGAK